LDSLGLYSQEFEAGALGKRDWAKGVTKNWRFGEQAALALLDDFITTKFPRYETVEPRVCMRSV
jgi:deoxyribodipyrimidine photolyase